MTSGLKRTRESKPPIKGCGAEPAALFYFQFFWTCKTVANIRHHHLLTLFSSSSWKFFLHQIYSRVSVITLPSYVSSNVHVRELPNASPNLYNDYNIIDRMSQFPSYGQHYSLVQVSSYRTATNFISHFSSNMLPLFRNTDAGSNHLQAWLILALYQP